MKMKLPAKIYSAIVFCFLFAPIVVLLVFSFNDAKSLSVMSGFSFRWYEDLMRDTNTLASVKNTLLLAAAATAVSTVIGTLAAVGIDRLRSRWYRAAMNTVTDIPMTNPDIICTPYIILQVLPKLRQMDRSLPEAAMDLGCTPMGAFFKVELPEIAPGIVTGAIMAFTLSLDDFVISYFTSGNGFETLPIRIYAMTKKTVTPKMYALATIIFFVTLTLLLISNVVDNEDRRQLKELKKAKKREI